jgi:hypothetical protein
MIRNIAPPGAGVPSCLRAAHHGRLRTSINVDGFDYIESIGRPPKSMARQALVMTNKPDPAALGIGPDGGSEPRERKRDGLLRHVVPLTRGTHVSAPFFPTNVNRNGWRKRIYIAQLEENAFVFSGEDGEIAVRSNKKNRSRRHRSGPDKNHKIQPS